MEKIAVERSTWVNASREHAWRAVTEPEQLNQWYATYYHWDIPALAVGAQVRFYNKDDQADTQIATIEVIDSLKQFTLHWQADARYPAVTLITSFLMAEENGGTRVTIVESGYEALPDDERQQWFDATATGYTMSMENLKAYLEGRIIPY